MAESCAAQHMGMWLARPNWLTGMVAAYTAGQLQPTQRQRPNTTWSGKTVYLPGDDPMYDAPLYVVNDYGVASVSISGAMTKGRSSFGGTSSVRVRQGLRTAERDQDVRGIMLAIDSPGGTVAGQQPLADDVARIARSGKPLAAHAEDGMHSAALWTGSQASFVSASPMTEIGSIGTVATVYDYSGAMAQDGIKVHVISTGEMKGAFTPGTEITDEQLAELQSRVSAINEFFLTAVSKGRKMSRAAVEKLADGRDWLAADAQAKGLIDAVMSADEAMTRFVKELDRGDRERKSANRTRMAAVKIAELDTH